MQFGIFDNIFDWVLLEVLLFPLKTWIQKIFRKHYKISSVYKAVMTFLNLIVSLCSLFI